MEISQRPAILVVDDEFINRALLANFLEAEYEVLEAGNGREAAEILSERYREVEAIILDLRMPVMDGFAFLELYSATPEWKDIPVLISTSEDGIETEMACLNMGASDFIRKPFHLAVVYSRLQNNISRRRLHKLERERITSTFGKYVDPGIVDTLLREDKSGQEEQGGIVEIAVLFVDIRGFTTLSERLSPEEVVGVLNTYLTEAARAVKQNGGTLDKFIGDAAMAFWGAPHPCKDKAYRAARAAVDMMENVKEMESAARARYGSRVTFGIGIHLGPAVVGNIGAPDRMDYTAVGDTVNTASRLESNAAPGKIYISRAVADSLGQRAEMTSLGTSVHLKGKQEGFEVLTLDKLRGAEGGR